MSPLTRLRLFARDYLSEFGIAWSLARTRDCERNGGHRWGAATHDDMMGWHQTCSRCGCAQTLAVTDGTGTTTSSSMGAASWSGWS